jgi:integrase
MLKLARIGGLRCAEIAGVSSYNLVEDLLYVTGKGGRRRIVPVADAELIAAIQSADGWLFPSPYGGHYTPGWVSKVIGRALPVGLTAHQLRHTFATRSYAGNPDVLALGKVLGHSKPETTMRYVQTPIDSLRSVVASAA